MGHLAGAPPRRWKPQSPHDCPQCQSGAKLHRLRSKADIRPYTERKSRRGRKKHVNIHGFACPNLECNYCGVTDDTLHALVGYRSHNGIRRFKCQACAKVFTSRVNNPLYCLKTDRNKWNSSSGFSRKASMFQCWFASPVMRTSRSLARTDGNSQLRVHNYFFRSLVFTLVEMDELYTHIRATASAFWLWLAFDPVSKAIPSLHLGGRTKEDTFALVHYFTLRLVPHCIPATTTDGLRSYFYALTAHFGTWFRP